jgi:O-antigen ligase
MGFLLFVLVNTALFIRPSEIIPDLEAIPIYNILISSCLLFSFPALLKELSPRRLVDTPISVCILGLMGAVALSHLSHYNLSYTWMFGLEFIKIVLYYLLLVALLDSPARLRRFLDCLVGLIGLVSVLSLLHYQGILTIPGMKVAERTEVHSATGQVYEVLQLYGAGIFSDPNDLSVMLTVGLGLSLYKLGDRSSALRWLWVAPLIVFGYTISLTHSRGGFLAMLACAMGVFGARFGWKRAIPVAAVVLPLIFVLFAGRQTDLNTSSGTGQSRIQLWSLSMSAFRRVPLFGLGAGLLPDEIGHEAHNSYIQAYAELGFFGGTCFVGMYTCAFGGLQRLGPYLERIHDPELRRMRPYLLGIAAGYATGMLTLTRLYINPTYIVPGLVAVYLRLVAADVPSPLPVPRFDSRLVGRLIATSALVLGFFYVCVRVFARFG